MKEEPLKSDFTIDLKHEVRDVGSRQPALTLAVVSVHKKTEA